jgi:uncharacterized protein (DUF433 family)
MDDVTRSDSSADPLAGGFYTVSDVARLLRVGRPDRVRRWFSVSDDAAGPVIARDYEPVGGVQVFSFWDMIEVRFLEHFRMQGLTKQYLRKVADIARREFCRKHPFALSNAEFLTDRRRIFQRTAEQEGESVREMLSDQYEMYNAIEGSLSKGLSFDPTTFLAAEFRPLETECPRVIVNPHFAFGQPVIGERHVPTAALFRQWQAEEGDRKRVAAWWDLPEDDVAEAVEFETRMAA